jgi:hypothetical protein
VAAGVQYAVFVCTAIVGWYSKRSPAQNTYIQSGVDRLCAELARWWEHVGNGCGWERAVGCDSD